MADERRPRQTRLLAVSLDGEPASAIEEAAEILRAGGLVAFPTETVYGLGANACDAAAVAGIFAAKQRPLSDPLIVHIAALDQLQTVAASVPPIAQTLAERFWPGPLTLILPRGEAIPPIVAAGGETIGVRMPNHPVALALLRAAALPVAAPSANRFMHTSPTTAAHVLADLDGRIDCVLDGGPAHVGVESTVLDVTAQPPRILRPGGVTLEALRAVIPDVVGPEASAASATNPASKVARAPGQMERHYAPQSRLLVFDAQGEPALGAMRAEIERAIARGERVGVLLADGEERALAGLAIEVIQLGPINDLALISRHLYAALREMDSRGVNLIITHTFGTSGMGLALWDRLRRAAGGQFQALEDEQ
jgi:L-threonylcarbamoyladenylate synthase